MEAAFALLTLLTIPLSMAFRGFVLLHIWAWHIVPVFGLPALNVTQALGLSFVAAVLTHQSTPWTKDKNKDKKPHETFVEVVAYGLVTQALFLLIGWLIHLFQ